MFNSFVMESIVDGLGRTRDFSFVLQPLLHCEAYNPTLQLLARNPTTTNFPQLEMAIAFSY